MCILCHYKGDSNLVTRETREDEHRDGFWQCMRMISYGRFICVDCQQVGTRSHVCSAPKSVTREIPRVSRV
jgi:hypothetical protein